MRRRGWRTSVLRAGLVAVLLSLAPAAPAVVATAPQAAGLQTGIAFDGYSPLGRTDVLFERLLTPLWATRAREAYAERGEDPPPYTLDIKAERFSVYVPDAPPPPAGYGLMVFVPPWNEAAVPRRWRPVLDDAGMLFVTAAASGNDAPVLPRRAALALHAAANVAARWPVDPARIYVGGFSGGARVALHLAIGYPDVFSGALIDGSSDTIGSFLVPFPPTGLLHRAQEHLRLVYAWGTADTPNADGAAFSIVSARRACLPRTARLPMPDRGHQPVDAGTFRRALHLLEEPREVDGALDDCRARLQQRSDEALAGVRERQAAGRLEKAREALGELDAQFGHLALPQSLELDRELPRHE
jgi:hypothetical protein